MSATPPSYSAPAPGTVLPGQQQYPAYSPDNVIQPHVQQTNPEGYAAEKHPNDPAFAPYSAEQQHQQPQHQDTRGVPELQQYQGLADKSQGQQPQQPQGGRNIYSYGTPLASLQRNPVPVDCPHCGVRELTVVEAVSGGTTHAVAALLCFCFCLGCIPYCISSLKDIEHKCGHCGTLLAVAHSSGRTEVVQPRN